MCVGIPIRLFFARRVKTLSPGKAGLYAIGFGLAASLLSTWFPVLPLAAGAILIFIAGHATSKSALISVPIFTAAMGVETALVDATFFRVLLKGSALARFKTLLMMNVLNAAVALALGLGWAFRHMPIFIAALDRCC